MLINQQNALNVIENNNLNLDVNLDFIDDILKFQYNIINIDYEIENDNIERKNYDNLFLKNYNDDYDKNENKIDNIIDKKFNFNKSIDISFYSPNLISKFISFNVARYILNNLNNKIIYKKKNREIVIYYKNKIKDNIIKKITSILDFFDYLTQDENKYVIEIYLTKKNKIINLDVDEIGPDNINSGATLPGHYIILWRYEELYKVLIHELIHYLKLDMFKYQDKFRDLYKDIIIVNNLNGIFNHQTNPNETYTELLAIIIMAIWKYKYEDYKDISLNKYINKRLTIELGWSYHQIAKIIKFFKCYNNYESLFSKSCQFKQDTNVLSYFILKTFYLQNINSFLKYFNINTLIMTDEISNQIFENINLLDPLFVQIINNCIQEHNDTKDISLRMTCLD